MSTLTLDCEPAISPSFYHSEAGAPFGEARNVLRFGIVESRSQNRHYALAGEPLERPSFYTVPPASLAYAKQQLYESSGGTQQARNQMLHSLREILNADSVFPTISVDEDGGVLAEWHFGDTWLEIDADPTGKMSYAVRVNGTRRNVRSSMEHVSSLLEVLSDAAKKQNPNWRSMFTG